MLKKKIIFVLSGILLTTTVTVFGATIKKDLAVYVNNIKVLFNFRELDLKDARGDKVEPLVINDSVYLPLRAIAESLDVKVDWNDETKAVQLSNPSKIIVHENGLYEAMQMVGGNFSLGNKICDTTAEVKWAVETIDGNFLISEYKNIDGNFKGYIFSIIDRQGNVIETLFGSVLIVEITSFDGENLCFERYIDVGRQNFETYEYSFNIKSKEMKITGYVPSNRDSLGHFNGDVEAFEKFKKDHVDSEQNRIDELEDLNKF